MFGRFELDETKVMKMSFVFDVQYDFSYELTVTSDKIYNAVFHE